ncbi:MAG TPA: DUF4350 domain-containing protein [Pyrinomonadaceae bacterium]|nr:DUF4350 domain-containing protein [Pyrinomonadaceae bacterium]
MFIQRLPRTLAALLLLCAAAHAQQVADPDFKPPVNSPAYKEGRGPVVLVDEAHHNFHTASGRYQPFAELLRRDGYRVGPSKEPFTKESLRRAEILVVSNAIAERNAGGDWSLPNPSAFTDEEVAAVREWVRGGGSLLLIADHMPMGGAAEKLGAAFGVRWNNGFAVVPGAQTGTLTFTRAAGTLRDHAITRGRSAAERVDQVSTFTGSAFQVDSGAEPLLVFDKDVVSLMPQVAWQFTEQTPRVAVGGWYQGAALRFGKGRIALFGEAAMFTAQLAGPNRTRVGMNAPQAPQNAQFLLNVLHWLSKKI